jgi:hypothetical protein
MQMAKLTNAGFMLTAGLLSGCANPYPLPIVSVSEEEAVIRGDNNARILNPAWMKGKSYRGLNAAQTMPDLLLNLDIYHTLYSNQYDALVNTMNTADGATVLGGIWGVAGALTGTKAWMYQGAGVAGVSALYTDHYQIKVQSENYYKASEAMRCMYNVVGAMPNGVELSPEGFRTVNIATNDVTSKLLRVQRDVVLAQPDLDRLKKALLLPTPTPVDKNAMKAFTEDKVDDEVLPRIEKCVSEF